MAICKVITIADADITVLVVNSTNTYNMGSCLIFFVCVCFMVKMTKLLKLNDTDFMIGISNNNEFKVVILPLKCIVFITESYNKQY